jgi:hypothetical protein
MRWIIIVSGVSLLSAPAMGESDQHPPSRVACEFKWQDAGKPPDYEKFINDCIKSNSPASSPKTAPNDVHWDQNRAIHNARFDHAVNQMHICARDAATLALRTGVRNREQIGSTVVSLCKAQLALLFMGAKAAGISSQEQTNFALSLVDSEIDSVLRLGR